MSHTNPNRFSSRCQGESGEYQNDSVDGIRPSPVEVGRLFHFIYKSQGFINLTWYRISSINSVTWWDTLFPPTLPTQLLVGDIHSKRRSTSCHQNAIHESTMNQRTVFLGGSGQTSHSPLRPFWLSLSRTMKFNILVKPYQKTGHLDRNVRFELFGIEKIVVWEGSMRWNRVEIMIKRDSLQNFQCIFFWWFFWGGFHLPILSDVDVVGKSPSKLVSFSPVDWAWPDPFNRRSNGAWWFIPKSL